MWAYNGPCQKHLLFHGFTTSQSFLEVGNCTALSLFFGDKKIYLLMKDTVARLPSIWRPASPASSQNIEDQFDQHFHFPIFAGWIKVNVNGEMNLDILYIRKFHSLMIIRLSSIAENQKCKSSGQKRGFYNKQPASLCCQKNMVLSRL